MAPSDFWRDTQRFVSAGWPCHVMARMPCRNDFLAFQRVKTQPVVNAGVGFTQVPGPKRSSRCTASAFKGQGAESSPRKGL